MKPDAKKFATSTVVFSLLWALAIVATAFLFRGKAAEYWIESALIAGALGFVVLKPRRPATSAR